MVIETSFDVRWREPVWVKTSAGIPQAVRGPRQALDFLTYRRPALSDGAFESAKRLCIQALRKETTCDAARRSFIDAARQADLDA
ncbi:DUF982 domain-containing protein [Neorhizobium sp. 2083]|uniref:DUF982 domain-containing protein n=1 Tax=Neorhizobium sp. 2083 TaxID=2817762 RepID=UPI00286CFDD2|nr:DUF982 domain-containing protein [Neorhizobium sp. 2083]